MKKILIIEDDLWISTSLKLYLENSNFEVEVYNTWENAVSFIKKIKPDLIILDINLPVQNWIEITEDLRKTDSTPIIILTARWEEDDRVKWLEVWADDYIAKPFSPRELLARIHTIIRRVSSIENISPKYNNIVKFLDFEVDFNKNFIKKWDKNIILTANEFEIFKKLLNEKWWIVSRETIMKDIIWYENYAYDRTIDTHIKNIRKKLGSSNYILTIRWVWYRLNLN